MESDAIGGPKSARVIASIVRFLRFVFHFYRFFTPHYWRMRAHRDQVACEMQAMLLAPFDPYALELRSRSINPTSTCGTMASDDNEWNPVMEKLSAQALERRLATVGAVEIAAWAVEDVHSAFASIDQDVIAGVARQTGSAIHSFADLDQRLAPHSVIQRIAAAQPLAHTDTYKHALRPLVGTIGEETVLRHLHSAGVDSHLAPNLNTPGWDLSIWNHAANVKTWDDVSNLSGHFDRYPGIPAIVPGDASGIPTHSIHFDPTTGEGLHAIHNALDAGHHGVVIADNALSGAAVHDHLQHAETLATHGNAVFHAHLPYVTLALSGVREFRLLSHGNTDILSASKNVSLDAMGTGVGGVAGAKVGAVVGTIICPGFGTVAGGILGGIFGAKKGRKYTAEIKEKPFKEAFAAYELALADFQSKAKVYEDEATVEFNKARAEHESRLKKHAVEAQQRVEEARQALDSWVVYDSWLQPDEACGFIGESLKKLTSVRTEIEGRYKTLHWWRKFIWPDVTTLAQQEALTFLRRIQRKLEALHRAARQGKPINRGQLSALLGAVGLMQEQVGEFLERIYAAQRERDEQARSILNEALYGILQERKDVEAELHKKLENLGKQIRDAIQPVLTQLNERIERVRQEGAKLGVSL